MEVTSLGYRTDLMIRALEGSVITDHGDCIVVRSPANPAFWWGNFLLLAAPPGPGQSGRWLARFAAEFPDAAHVALGIDVTDAREVQTAEFLEAGLRLDLSTVLTASAVHRPPRPGHGEHAGHRRGPRLSRHPDLPLGRVRRPGDPGRPRTPARSRRRRVTARLCVRLRRGAPRSSACRRGSRRWSS
ncbi:MAG TPA: hypothetical protein VGA04_17925 [Streptosporangiaceae bacterium]